MRNLFLVKLLSLTILAGMVGLAVSILCLAMAIDRNEPVREWYVTFYWASYYYLLSAPFGYLPAMLLLRQILKDCRPAFVFPILASAVSLVPGGLFILDWGGGWRDLLSPDAFLFYALFVPVGLLFGIGFVWLCRKETHKNRLQPTPR